MARSWSSAGVLLLQLEGTRQLLNETAQLLQAIGSSFVCLISLHVFSSRAGGSRIRAAVGVEMVFAEPEAVLASAPPAGLACVLVPALHALSLLLAANAAVTLVRLTADVRFVLEESD